ncbi:MAG: T9SS type A sorting domain-containing protein, partial [Bacteroidia bacterium]|nr:T9SS type A sorting domain-containing protein [Bacteroidia bacterium]
GHDIVAVLDDDYSNVVVLNKYYQANINDFTSGIIRFPLKNLSAGKHTLKLKAWDVANNSSEAEIEFVVTGDFFISRVACYPNPTNDYTYFSFEHNQAGSKLDVMIEIFDQAGRRISFIKSEIGSSGTLSNPIRWDLEDSAIVPRSGIYIYRIVARNNDGAIASKSGKMMISN